MFQPLEENPTNEKENKFYIANEKPLEATPPIANWFWIGNSYSLFSNMVSEL